MMIYDYEKDQTNEIKLHNVIKFDDYDIKLIWQEKPVPKDMKVRQIYAVAFSKDGRILLKIENYKNEKYYSLAGGTPESFDKNLEATLRREYLEEINTTLEEKIYYLGFQEVEGDKGFAAYAQVRTVALIDKIGEPSPDPDNGKIYKRVLVSPVEAIKLLNWGNIGQRIIEKATEIAKAEFGIENICESEEYV